jgi:hypothetical protein
MIVPVEMQAESRSARLLPRSTALRTMIRFNRVQRRFETLAEVMIKTAPKPQYQPGTRLRITQRVRVGHREWTTQVEGVVESDGLRPVGGIEMGGKASYCAQPTIRLRRENREITVVTVDEDTRVETLS